MADLSSYYDDPNDPGSAFYDPGNDPGQNVITPTPPAPNSGVITVVGQPSYGTPTIGGGGRGGGGGFGGGGDSGDFGPQFDFSAFPRFNPKYREFTPLTLEQAQNEPGYRFAAQEGQQGIERSAAARGALRTGGTLKDIGSWLTDFAARNYGDANQRELQRFQTNYGVEKDMFAPILSEAQIRAQAAVQAGLAKYGRYTAWNAPHQGGGGGGGGVLSFEEWKRENGYA